MQNRPIVTPCLTVPAGGVATSFPALFVRLSAVPAMIIATSRLLFVTLFTSLSRSTRASVRRK
jgi:hypothetical protein